MSTVAAQPTEGNIYMAEPLACWVDREVNPYLAEPVSWLSTSHFFRDPSRPQVSDRRFFFSPADGVILYQKEVDAAEGVLDVKGCDYSVREILRDPSLEGRYLVVGIFMTFYDVHVNRIPYAGRLSYRRGGRLRTHNLPMLDMEHGLLQSLRVDHERAEYLHHNERVINRVDVNSLRMRYWVVQIADYDVDSILPFRQQQNIFRSQGRRFSQIRYGSQVELVVPIGNGTTLTPVQPVGWHVKGGLDPLLRVENQ